MVLLQLGVAGLVVLQLAQLRTAGIVQHTVHIGRIVHNTEHMRDQSLKWLMKSDLEVTVNCKAD